MNTSVLSKVTFSYLLSTVSQTHGNGNVNLGLVYNCGGFHTTLEKEMQVGNMNMRIILK